MIRYKGKTAKQWHDLYSEMVKNEILQRLKWMDILEKYKDNPVHAKDYIMKDPDIDPSQPMMNGLD